jgi:hypothetical protein
METGIRKTRNGRGYEAYVRVDGRQRSKHFSKDTPIEVMREWRTAHGGMTFYGRAKAPADIYPPAQPGQTWIYFIKSGSYVKIGQARNPIRRLADLQTSHPKRLVLLAAFQAPMHLERRIHDHFIESHQGGEWFYATAELRDLANLIAKGELDAAGLEPQLRRVERDHIVNPRIGSSLKSGT